MITKPLEWKNSEIFSNTIIADFYSIWTGGYKVQLEDFDGSVVICDTVEEAKEIAQQKREEYVLSCLAIDIKKLQAELQNAKIDLEDMIYQTYLLEGGQS